MHMVGVPEPASPTVPMAISVVAQKVRPEHLHFFGPFLKQRLAALRSHERALERFRVLADQYVLDKQIQAVRTCQQYANLALMMAESALKLPSTSEKGPHSSSGNDQGTVGQETGREADTGRIGSRQQLAGGVP